MKDILRLFLSQLAFNYVISIFNHEELNSIPRLYR